MTPYDVGDRVRIDIPDEKDPDHHHHAEHGEITNIISDDAGETTGDDRDSYIYRVTLDTGGIVDVREQDLRNPIDADRYIDTIAELQIGDLVSITTRGGDKYHGEVTEAHDLSENVPVSIMREYDMSVGDLAPTRSVKIDSQEEELPISLTQEYDVDPRVYDDAIEVVIKDPETMHDWDAMNDVYPVDTVRLHSTGE